MSTDQKLYLLNWVLRNCSCSAELLKSKTCPQDLLRTKSGEDHMKTELRRASYITQIFVFLEHSAISSQCFNKFTSSILTPVHMFTLFPSESVVGVVIIFFPRKVSVSGHIKCFTEQWPSYHDKLIMSYLHLSGWRWPISPKIGRSHFMA